MPLTWILKTFSTSRPEEQQQHQQNDSTYEDVTSNPHQLDKQQFTALRSSVFALFSINLQLKRQIFSL